MHCYCTISQRIVDSLVFLKMAEVLANRIGMNLADVDKCHSGVGIEIGWIIGCSHCCCRDKLISECYAFRAVIFDENEIRIINNNICVRADDVIENKIITGN